MDISNIPILEALELIEDLMDEGLSEDEAIAKTAEFIDLLIKSDVLIPEPYGTAVEALDGVIIEMLLKLAWKWAQNSDARKEARAKRRGARQARRAARKAAKA